MSREVARSSSSFFSRILPYMGKPGRNMVFSPYSIYSILVMSSGGAAGRTLQEMAEVLSINNPDEFHKEMRRMHVEFKKYQGKLCIAEAIFTRSKLLKKYEKMCKKNYFALVKSTTFPQPGENEVNGFVNSITKGMIPKIVSNLDDSVSMVLVNAIYFNMDWSDPFKKKDTREKEFKLLDSNNTTRVKMMRKSNNVEYFGIHKLSENGMIYKSCRLPYIGSQFSMMFIKPMEIRSEKEFNLVYDLAMKEDKVDFIEKIKKEQRRKELKSLQIPKFKIETEISLEDIMKELGMKQAFDMAQADFSRMVNDKIYVSKIIHKAKMDVDEKGTVAAAATAMVMMFGSAMRMSQPTDEFILDSPFYAFLIHENTSTILFGAKVFNPNE